MAGLFAIPLLFYKHLLRPQYIAESSLLRTVLYSLGHHSDYHKQQFPSPLSDGADLLKEMGLVFICLKDTSFLLAVFLNNVRRGNFMYKLLHKYNIP